MSTLRWMTLYKITWSIQRHVKENHDIQNKITCCKFCDKVFYDVSLESDHISNMHADCSDNTLEKASKLKEQRNLLVEKLLSVYNPSALEDLLNNMMRHKGIFINQVVKFLNIFTPSPFVVTFSKYEIA